MPYKSSLTIKQTLASCEKNGLALQTMTSLEQPETIRHFQSICDACQELSSLNLGPSELQLYADGYLHALRKCEELDRREQEKLEKLTKRWLLDPSSFIGPDGDFNNLFYQKEVW